MKKKTIGIAGLGITITGILFGGFVGLFLGITGVIVTLLAVFRPQKDETTRGWMEEPGSLFSGQIFPIEHFGLSRRLSPAQITHVQKIYYTGKCESEHIIPLIAELAMGENGWLAVPWCTLRARYEGKNVFNFALDDCRVPDLTREYASCITTHMEIRVSNGAVTARQTNHPPEFLFNGVKHAVEYGYVEVVHGDSDDYLVLTDKGIDCFPLRETVSTTDRVCNGKTLGLENWRDQSSHAVKLAEIAAIWGKEGGIPDYMSFAVGNMKRIDIVNIERQFFKNHRTSFGDVEIHESRTIPDETVLRIRGADTFALEIEIDGVKYPMYQAGHGDGPYVRFCPDPKP